MKKKHILTLLSVIAFIIAIVSDVIPEQFEHIKIGFFGMSSICYIIGFIFLALTEVVKDKE